MPTKRKVPPKAPAKVAPAPKAKKAPAPATKAAKAAPAPGKAKAPKVSAKAVLAAEMTDIEAQRVARAVLAQKPGKPGLRSPKVIDRFLERVSEGESVRSITRDADMPSATTVFRWLDEDPEFAEAYARAKAVGLELRADELLDIADDGTNDWMTRYSPSGREYQVVNDEAIQRSKIRIATRQWLLERLASSKYGAITNVKHSGAVGVGMVEMESDQAGRVAQAVLDGIKDA